MTRPETNLPTIRQARDRLTELIDKGFGDLAVQIIVVPDSTLQSLARSFGQSPDDKPALMIHLAGDDGGMAVGLISVERLDAGGMPTRTVQ